VNIKKPRDFPSMVVKVKLTDRTSFKEIVDFAFCIEFLAKSDPTS